MAVTLTLNLTDSTESSLRQAASELGVSETEFAEEAVQKYLFLRRFRRARLNIQEQLSSIPSDEEIFSLVS
jgi:hypothetical protein